MIAVMVSKRIEYDPRIEKAISNIVKLLSHDYKISKRSIALLLLQKDESIIDTIKKRESKVYKLIEQIVEKTYSSFDKPLNYVIAMNRQRVADDIADKAVIYSRKKNSMLISEMLNRITINPITGIPILVLVLYYGLYKFVGVFGAGTLVDYLEGQIFDAYINPLVNNIATTYIPWKPLQELLALDYGVITLGIRYAIAIILPIVGTFFLVFSLIEDSGYLPRLALLIDKVFKGIGLNGRAVIPLTLGFGCDTMATIVSRTLETRRERIISTLLLALAIPCSAQLGVIMALMSQIPAALVVWMVFVFLVFLLVGYLASKVLPGDKPSFYMELPPLRFPKITNVLTKTYTRMRWYFFEVVPFFIAASVVIWLGNITGLFQHIIDVLAPIMHLLDLPDEAAKAFVFGFFRRDYGAAGLYDLHKAGLLSGNQVLVASVTLTLFIPCIAQASVMAKERGIKTALAIMAFIFPFAFFMGFVLNSLLNLLGVSF